MFQAFQPFEPRLMVLRLMLQFIKRGSDDQDAELEAGAPSAGGRQDGRSVRKDDPSSVVVQISLMCNIFQYDITMVLLMIPS